MSPLGLGCVAKGMAGEEGGGVYGREKRVEGWVGEGRGGWDEDCKFHCSQNWDAMD